MCANMEDQQKSRCKKKCVKKTKQKQKEVKMKWDGQERETTTKPWNWEKQTRKWMFVSVKRAVFNTQ